MLWQPLHCLHTALHCLHCEPLAWISMEICLIALNQTKSVFSNFLKLAQTSKHRISVRWGGGRHINRDGEFIDGEFIDCILLYLMVYSMVPFFMMRKSLLGAVMLWATDFLPFLKKVSGVHTLVTIRLFSLRISIGPSYINLRSTHVCRKNTSIVYSWDREIDKRKENILGIHMSLFSKPSTK